MEQIYSLTVKLKGGGGAGGVNNTSVGISLVAHVFLPHLLTCKLTEMYRQMTTWLYPL